MRLIVFDLDGTLIDSRRDLADSANALIVERGGQPLSVETITGMVGEGAPLLVRRALTAAGLVADLDSALPRFLELYDERLLVNTAVYPGTVAAIGTLARRAALAVLTNKPQYPTGRILDGLGLSSLFNWVIGGDTPHGRKPDPSGLLWLMAAAGASSAETLMVGDSAIDLKTARAANVRLCLVRYGFGFRTVEGLVQSGDCVVETPAGLMNLD